MTTSGDHARAPHQLGGVDDFARPVPGIDDATRFHEGWEARIFGLWRIVTDRRLFTVDHFRHAIERLDPSEYHQLGYFERWLAAVEQLVVEHGHVTADELRSAQRNRFANHDDHHFEPPNFPARGPERLPPPEPAQRLEIGASVKLVGGLGRHHRLPDWAHGCRGTIRAVRGDFELPDLIVAGSSDNRRYALYSVEIAAREAFEDAHPSDLVCLDVYHPYLEEER